MVLAEPSDKLIFERLTAGGCVSAGVHHLRHLCHGMPLRALHLENLWMGYGFRVHGLGCRALGLTCIMTLGGLTVNPKP